MRPLLLVVASIAIAWLVADLASGSAGAVGATIAAHAVGVAIATRDRRRIEATALSLGLPDWVGVQGEKNARKLTVVAGTGVLLSLAVAWSPRARSGLSAFDLAFQLGAFAGEFAAIVASARLRRALAGWPGSVCVP